MSKLFPKPGTLCLVKREGGVVYFGGPNGDASYRQLKKGVIWMFLSQQKNEDPTHRIFKFLDGDGKVVKRYWYGLDQSKEKSFDRFFQPFPSNSK